MIDSETLVARAVLDHSETAPVFQRHRIDYCCQGNRTIAAACQDRGVDAGALLAELQAAIAQRGGAPGLDAAALSTPALIAHIVDTHHGYLRQALPFVAALGAKVARVHGDRDGRLLALALEIRELIDALEPHLDTEETVLFPALAAATPDRRVIERELASMHADHLEVGATLDRIRTVTDDFTMPDWACTSYRTLFAELAQLEGDVLRHVHLENHVLMPRFA
jgi:regulator of cell morphogenesis and NO signaling